MKDTDLYSRILGLLEPWFVEAVESNTVDGRVHIRVEHGSGVPWAESKGRFTVLMERLIIDLLTECATLTGARRIMRIPRGDAWGVMERAVRRAGNANTRTPRDILARLQEPGALQGRHPLLLRRPGPLPGQFVTGATHGKPGRVVTVFVWRVMSIC
ncbi:transposase family protein [Desulfovibrio sulfodismutans]|uniref:Transposase family protein n=1 Tax=Desulfolutivibrio sulfodismutans TaxID=63561 RepID=A0A7K3NP41_9BACT|nr:transposase family protein [Desulfolutivibrio sulfodismutans]NDY57956.1 transposase family protein [Desulfolutivibrio sulfodismutans]QLA14626.1 hypothetical protein GD606_19970 [Desulfolutivibrio sulfodismutans DSM 3696]